MNDERQEGPPAVRVVLPDGSEDWGALVADDYLWLEGSPVEVGDEIRVEVERRTVAAVEDRQIPRGETPESEGSLTGMVKMHPVQLVTLGD